MYFPYFPLQLEIMGSPQEGCGMVVDVEEADLAVVLFENHDEGVDKRPLDAVIRRRFVPLVDDPDRRQQHPCADVECRLDPEVQVRLFQFQLAGFLAAFDEAALELEHADAAQALAEAGIEQ